MFRTAGITAVVAGIIDTVKIVDVPPIGSYSKLQ